MKDLAVFKSEAGRQAILTRYDEIINQWPVPYETKIIPTRHGQTFVITFGNEGKPPLILLHGSTSNSVFWMGDAARLAAHYRVYAVDMPGEPGKSEPLRRKLGIACSEWMEDVYKGLSLDKAYLMGISLGGWVVSKFAVENPERVGKLVLLCPPGIAPQRKSFLLRIMPWMLFGNYGKARIMKIISGNTYILPEAMEYLRLISNHFNPRVVVFPLFTDDELRRLTMPVIMFGGAEDVLLYSDKTAARLSKLLPRVTTKVLPNTGHFLINLTDEIIDYLQA
ncbi:MAG: alpha/beta fold hydrolase [Candidatus Saccharibacteria bacterium]